MTVIRTLIATFLATVTVGSCTEAPNGTSFTIDYDNNQFLLDGNPFRYISGEIHYFRTHPDQWDNRLKRVRDAGINAVQVYVPWNFHEAKKGKYIFSCAQNIEQFLQLCSKNDLYVLLRPGPYICAEWENGGLPWWLLRNKDIKQRTSDPRFTSAVKRWFDVLMPKMVPFLRRNGGPILMVQVENEYGSYYACDHNYTAWLRDLMKGLLGNDTLLYTTDLPVESNLKCGATPGAYATVDFGPRSNSDIDKAFAAQRQFSPKGPLVNSEFYPGWFVTWNQKKQSLPSTADVIRTCDYMYKRGASFSMYMFHGGTNFGYWNGAETNAPLITSYDYSAPMTEAGDATANYKAIRDWIALLEGWPAPPRKLPDDNPKLAYGRVKLGLIGSITNLALLKIITKSSECIRSIKPMSFEQLNHPLGFVLYQTTLWTHGTKLTIPVLKDHGFVILDDELQGVFVDILDDYSAHSVLLRGAKPGKQLSILVENRGRQTFETINDFKGILSDVTLDGQVIEGWTQCGIHLEQLQREMRSLPAKRSIDGISAIKKSSPASAPSIYTGTFAAETIADTYLDTTGWGKGILFINGHNMGRYWPEVGPQITLYIPAPYLRKQNTIIMVELKTAGICTERSCEVSLIDHPIFNFTSSEVTL